LAAIAVIVFTDLLQDGEMVSFCKETGRRKTPVSTLPTGTQQCTQPDCAADAVCPRRRTDEQDRRIAVHEAGHAVCARLLGHPLGGATVDPNPNGKYGGLVWGPRHSVAFGNDGDDVPELCDKLRDLMPQDGEARGDAADVYLHALNRCIELVAASVAERMLLEGEPVPSVSDVEHTIKYASLVCRSPEAAERFIRLCETMADDLLRPHGHALIALSTVLRIRRTLSGEEIDDVIATTVAGFELASEQARRRRWQHRIANAGRFKSEALQR
jgi:hypothetical protein